MTRIRVGITAVLACIAALAIVPSAFAHHGRIGGSMNCQGVVSYTASSWVTSNVLAKTHNDVRVYLIQSNGAAVSPAQQVGSGQFNSANGFAFSGTFTVAAGVNSVKLQVKEIGPWGNGSGSSNGNHVESSVTIVRPATGCAPPPPVCPSAANAQVSSSSDIGIAGGTATVSFTLAGGCQNVKLSLVSYKAPGPTFDANTADQQTVHDSKTVVLGAGNHTLSVAVPNCYYQVDFVYGDVITKFGPAGSSNFYSAQGRLIKARNGGTASCSPPPTDVCPNITAVQTSVPSGMIKDASGNCVTPPTDVCPNITGVQTSVPAGMTKDASGNCTTPPPPTDVCPNIDGNQTSIPSGMTKDGNGQCLTPASTPPPAEPTPLVTATPAAAPVPPAATPAAAPVATPAAAKPAPKAKVKKAAVKAKKKVVKTTRVVVKKQATAKKAKPRELPFTP